MDPFSQAIVSSVVGTIVGVIVGICLQLSYERITGDGREQDASGGSSITEADSWDIDSTRQDVR